MIKVLHDKDIPWKVTEKGDFCYERKSMTQHSAAEKLGLSIFKLKPGKKAFPLHAHYANEEAIYVLQGQGKVRGLEDIQEITVGDYVVFPTGKDYAHQIINDSNEDLMYLCFSTMIAPDVIEYLDSNKLGLKVGSAPGGIATPDSFLLLFKKEDAVDYYEGEK